MRATPEQTRSLFAQPPSTLGEPEPLTAADIPAVQALSAAVEARDYEGLGAAPWPGSDAAWRAALKRDGPEMLLGWRDEAGKIVAYTTLRLRGEQGLITAAVVDPRLDEGAVLDRMVEEAVRRLQERGAATVGVEVDAPERESVQSWIRRGGYPVSVGLPLLYVADAVDPSAPPSDWGHAPDCCALVERLAPGLDVSRDLDPPDSPDAGGLTVVHGADGPDAFACWRAEPLALPARRAAQMAVVQVLAAATPSAFDQLIGRLKETAAALPGPGLLVLPSEPGCHWATQPLLHSEFLALSPDFRLVLSGAPRAPAAAAAAAPVWTSWRL